MNTNDTLISLNWQAESGWWSSPPFENVTNINDFTVSKTSKSFSAAAIVQDEPSGTDYNFGILIALHDASDQVQFLYGYEAQNNGVNVTEDFVWNNVTGNLPADPELKLGSLQNATLSNFAVAGPINNTLISCIHVNCPTTTDSDHWQSYYILQQNNTNASARKPRSNQVVDHKKHYTHQTTRVLPINLSHVLLERPSSTMHVIHFSNYMQQPPPLPISEAKCPLSTDLRFQRSIHRSTWRRAWQRSFLLLDTSQRLQIHRRTLTTRILLFPTK